MNKDDVCHLLEISYGITFIEYCNSNVVKFFSLQILGLVAEVLKKKLFSRCLVNFLFNCWPFLPELGKSLLHVFIIEGLWTEGPWWGRFPLRHEVEFHEQAQRRPAQVSGGQR